MVPTPGVPTPAREVFARRPVSVVLADDSERFRAGMVRALERRPETLLLSDIADGRSALAAAQQMRPDVLLVNDRMPGLSGSDVARAVSTDPDLRNVRVLILTADEGSEVAERARHAGALDVVDKAQARAVICDTVIAAGRTPARSWDLLGLMAPGRP